MNESNKVFRSWSERSWDKIVIREAYYEVIFFFPSEEAPLKAGNYNIQNFKLDKGSY